jgi:hypothetical protein
MQSRRELTPAEIAAAAGQVDAAAERAAAAAAGAGVGVVAGVAVAERLFSRLREATRLCPPLIPGCTA